MNGFVYFSAGSRHTEGIISNEWYASRKNNIIRLLSGFLQEQLVYKDLHRVVIIYCYVGLSVARNLCRMEHRWGVRT